MSPWGPTGNLSSFCNLPPLLSATRSLWATEMPTCWTRKAPTHVWCTVYWRIIAAIDQYWASHHRATKDTWVDIVLTDNNDIIVSHERKLPTFPSKHDIKSVTIEIFRPELPDNSNNYECFGKITAADLSLLLQNKDWSVFSFPDDEFELEQGLTQLRES